MKAITTQTRLGRIVWQRSDIEEFPLAHVPHLLLMEGASLSDVFAPHLLLRAEAPELWRLPFKIRNVVLADVLEMETEQASLQEVVLELMRAVLT